MPALLKPFDEMTLEDYAAIGLKCGLEVHQQLLTSRKLFCRCPAGRYSGEYDAEILRHMRPTLSELGEYDGTALMEKKTRKNIYYRIHHDTVCTYEFDDTPPFFMDDEALDIALELALLLRLNLVSELHVARKQYLDGSIPTGFQRTTILGVNGWIPFRDRRIGITQLGLEEDSCREVADVGHDRVYLTDRLGMPLIEVVTDPDMRTPEETAAVGQIIRRLCRSTGKVRTGYGAARQDTNVSVRGGTRIEIKGVPQITRIPRLIYNEAMRQCSLLWIREELERRGVTPETFEHTPSDVTRIVARAAYQPLRAAVDAGERVKCVVLSGFEGLLNEPTQEHTTFAKEFSDRVRVIACLTQLPNIVHSDTAADALSAREWKELRRRTRAGQGDALVLVWGNDADTETACSEIAIRAKEATIGVPSDTRQALKDGTNGFERVLPGAERMYPDTDLPPLAIDAERKTRIQAVLPAYFWDREAEYRRIGLPADTVCVLSISPRVKVYERLVDSLRIDPVFAAVVLIQRFKAWRRAGLPVDSLRDDEIVEAFRAYATGHIGREGVPAILTYMLRQEQSADTSAEARVKEAIEAMGLSPAGEEELDNRIAQALERVASPRFPTEQHRFNYIMGVLMTDLYGRIDARRVAARLASAMKLEDGARGPSATAQEEMRT
jgi:glutamyl-tRNA(Gln) amidotransferase subunit E